MCSKLRSKVMFCMLVTAMTAGMVTGCGEKNNNDTAQPTVAETAETTETTGGDGESTTSGEPVTLTAIYRKNQLTNDLKENPVFQRVSEETGVTIDWKYYGETDWEDQKALLLASGDLGDIVFGDGLSKEDIENNTAYFLPLEDYIENCPNIKKAFEEVPQLRSRVTSIDGHIYTLPNRQPCMPNTQDAFFINQKWLDNLGLKMPTTTDELYTVLKAFKEQDANGNGDPNDEIPLTATTYQSKAYEPLEPYLPFFGINTNMSDYKVEVKDGKVTYGAVRPELKEAIKFFHKLYEEGLFDQEALTQDYPMMQAKYQNPGEAIVGVGTSWVPSALVSPEYIDEYAVMMPLTGPQGTTGTRYNPEIFNIASPQFSVTKECKDPEAAMRYADKLYDEEISILTYFGPEGTCVEKTDDGKYKILPPQDGLTGDLWTWTNTPKTHGPKYVSEAMEKNIILDDNHESKIKLSINEQYQPYISNKEYYPIFAMPEDKVATLVALKADLEPCRDETIAKWIVNGGVDEEWDAYVQKMNDLGAEEYVNILQELYDAQAK